VCAVFGCSTSDDNANFGMNSAGSSSGGSASGGTVGSQGGSAGSANGMQHAGAGRGGAVSIAGGGNGGEEPQSFDAGPPVLNPNLDFLDENLIARAAVALLSCPNDSGFYRLLIYMRGVQDDFSYPGSFVECLAAVTTGCDEAYGCYGISALQGSETCDTCQDNIAVYCGVDGPFVQDCTKTGTVCEAGRCVEPGAVACDWATYDANCDEQGRPLDCGNDTVTVGPACPDFGLACSVEPSFAIESYCQGTGEPCDTSGDPNIAFDPVGSGCDGDVMHACVRFRTDNIDCRNLGPDFSCQSFGDSFFCGTASECDPRTYDYTCEGSAVTFCDAGKLTSIDCTEFGFTECIEGERSGICQ
jgi:hypothetical protein